MDNKEWLTDWLSDQLTDWPNNWLTHWLTDWPTDRLTDEPTDRPTYWPTDWLIDRQTDRPTDVCYIYIYILYKYTTYLRTFTYKWDNLKVTCYILLLLLLLLNIVLYNYFFGLVYFRSNDVRPEADRSIINWFVHYRLGSDVIFFNIIWSNAR